MAQSRARGGSALRAPESEAGQRRRLQYSPRRASPSTPPDDAGVYLRPPERPEQLSVRIERVLAVSERQRGMVWGAQVNAVQFDRLGVLAPDGSRVSLYKRKTGPPHGILLAFGVRRSVGSGPFQFGGCRDVGNGLGYVRVSADTSQASVLTRIMQWPYDCITGKELSTSSCFPKTHLPKYPSGITLMSRVHCFFSWVVICASENRHFGKILGTKSHRSQCARKHAQGCHVSQAALLSYTQEHEEAVHYESGHQEHP